MVGMAILNISPVRKVLCWHHFSCGWTVFDSHKERERESWTVRDANARIATS